MRGEHNSEEIVREIANDTDIPYELLFNELILSCQSMTFVSDELPKIIKGLERKV